MSMKVAFERFLTSMGITPSETFTNIAPPDFGAMFFEFARKNGYDISTDCTNSLSAAKLEADEIIDVGVHDGTPWLYNAFKTSRFVLVEPQKHGIEMVKLLPESFVFVSAAVGKEPGKLILKEHEEKSSLLSRTDVQMLPTDEYEVPVYTLDSIIEKHCQSSSIGLKIDTEGFEYDVLSGLDKYRNKVKFLIMEVSIKKRYSGERTFSEITALALEKGFHFYNLMNTTRPSPPNAYDVLFLQSGHQNFEP